MNIFQEKIKEVGMSLFPIVVLVFLLNISIVPVEAEIIIRFLIGGLLLLLGLGIFLMGVELSMTRIGEYLSHEIATSKSLIKIAVLSFILGFLITVAEPDLLILGSQVDSASGGSIPSNVLVYSVSVGVGVLITLGVFRIMRNMPLNKFMAIVYGVIFIFAIFTSEGFLAIAFDASGATTGALTTPFVLAVCAGLAKTKGGSTAEEDSFGLVGIMSAGPILAVMLMSVLTGQSEIQGEAEPFLVELEIFGPIIRIIPQIFFESLVALLPITILFFILNFIKFKIEREEIKEIMIGLIFTLIGLALFLTGVNGGFMDMGRLLGMKFAEDFQPFLPLLGMSLGFIVVLAEPAVHVLADQIEEVSGGHIPIKLIKLTLSIGVGTAIALSMIRILIPEVKLWWFLLFGFGMAIILSFKSDPIFVGIAYDAGGVASGPMTATFILAFAQGAAEMIETADVLIDGFGVIAMVAMSPVFSLILLGYIVARKKERDSIKAISIEPEIQATPDYFKEALLLCMCKRGLAEEIVKSARENGARGATILHGIGFSGMEVLSFEMPEEKESVMMVLERELIDGIIEPLINEKLIDKYFVLPTSAVGYSMPIE